MSRHLRSMALASLEAFVTHMNSYAGGNNFSAEEYSEGRYIVQPMLNLRLQCTNNSVEFSPSLEATRQILTNCLQEIVLSTKEFPRVEQEILPEVKGKSLHLLSVDWEEDHIQDLVSKAIQIFENNLTGPVRYRMLYDKYELLLNGEAGR